MKLCRQAQALRDRYTAATGPAHELGKAARFNGRDKAHMAHLLNKHVARCRECG